MTLDELMLRRAELQKAQTEMAKALLRFEGALMEVNEQILRAQQTAPVPEAAESKRCDDEDHHRGVNPMDVGDFA